MGPSGSTGSGQATYGYDVQNRLVSYTSGSTSASYAYDDDGDRVSETVNGTRTLFLTDTNNPTGYSQPIEVASSMGAAPSMTYELGDTVTAQSSGNGTAQLLFHDGHGSTRLLVKNGTLANPADYIAAMYSYDAFGGALGFNAATALTPWLFAGDGITDPASGTIFHSNGRQTLFGTDEFLTRDPLGYGSNSDPTTLNPTSAIRA